MSRHKRSRPGEGPYPYKERRLYYGTCTTHGTRYQSFYKGKIWVKACGKCRREAARISPGQESLFGLGVDLATGKDKTVRTIINMPRRPGKNTIRKLIGEGRPS